MFTNLADFHKLFIMKYTILFLALCLAACKTLPDIESSKPQNPPNYITENLLYMQPAMLVEKAAALKSDSPAVDTYLISFGSFGWQDVFLKEARLAQEIFDQKSGSKDRSLLLVNNLNTINQLPLATVTNLKLALDAIGTKADKNHDILMLYFASHGYPNGALSVEFDRIGLNQLDGEMMAMLLKNSGFKWKVIIISSCYSGKLINNLQNPNTLIITAAAADRSSFGCSDKAELTDFGRAFLVDGMGRTSSPVEAFEIAKKLIDEREVKEKISPHSEPQIFIGSEIGPYLKNQGR